MYKKTLQKQTTFISPKANEKQIDCILNKRRNLRHAKDAKANDMIHMGSDRRCVMATFVINTPKKDGSHETNKDKLRTTKQNNRKNQKIQRHITNTCSWEQEKQQHTRSWNAAEQKEATNNNRYWVHQWTGHHNNDCGQPTTHRTDERILSPLQVCRQSRRKMYRKLENHTNSSNNCVQIVGGDFIASLEPRCGVKRTNVGPHTLNGRNKRGDWMKQWLM